VKYTLQKNRSQDGFTLLEVIVAMGLFVTILVIASSAFNRIVSISSNYSNMEESNIEGIIGLEVLRHDLAQMGFGLPWGWSKGSPASSGSTPPSTIIDSTISYSESVDTLGLNLNDAPGGIPRAFASYAAIGAFSSDYIGLKGTTLGGSKESQRWTYIPYHNYSTSSGRESRPVSYSANNPQSGDKIILINSNVNDTVNKDHRLIVAPDDNTNFYQNFSVSSMSDDFLPTDDQNTYMVYGIGSVTPSMPFNRADFFIKTGNVPSFCEQLTTGVLYKATVNHNDGGYTYIPLLDCVADMQVVLGWDTSAGGSAGSVSAYSSLPKLSDGSVTATNGAGSLIQGWLSNANASRAKDIREHLKVVKVYILAQEGKRDPSYKSPTTSITVGDLIADGFRTKADYVLSTAQQQYRWKLYRIVVRPKNLVSNQR